MHVFLSSPKHDVLMVSYCGGWLFVVRRRMSCVVNVCGGHNECGHPRKPDCDEYLSKCLSMQYQGKVLIWLVQG